ncbi:phage tail protein [Faecalicatena orotica]|uniref:phage tail protein n=1 Tax=Faecalicatena orotica TaxID=1544 RepID=UPI0032180F0D
MASIYSLKKFCYIVLIDSKEVGGFSEISTTDITTDPIEYREGTSSVNTVYKQSGHVKYGNVTLKWGLVTSAEFIIWLQSAGDRACERKTIKIQLRDDLNRVAAEWEIMNAWPVKYTSEDLDNSSNEIPIESMELAHEGIKRM